MDEETRLLPVVKLDGREFLVDIGNRQFIDTGDLNRSIPMHSKRGHDMVDAMADTEWRCFAVYPAKGLEV